MNPKLLNPVLSNFYAPEVSPVWEKWRMVFGQQYMNPRDSVLVVKGKAMLSCYHA
jgi:hypothetical protein